MNGKIKIVPVDESELFYNVFLDDVDISNLTRSIKVELQAGHVPLVILEMVAVGVELPDNIAASVRVHKPPSKLIIWMTRSYYQLKYTMARKLKSIVRKVKK